MLSAAAPTSHMQQTSSRGSSTNQYRTRVCAEEQYTKQAAPFLLASQAHSSSRASLDQPAADGGEAARPSFAPARPARTVRVELRTRQGDAFDIVLAALQRRPRASAGRAAR